MFIFTLNTLRSYHIMRFRFVVEMLFMLFFCFFLSYTDGYIEHFYRKSFWCWNRSLDMKFKLLNFEGNRFKFTKFAFPRAEFHFTAFENVLRLLRVGTGISVLVTQKLYNYLDINVTALRSTHSSCHSIKMKQICYLTQGSSDKKKFLDPKSKFRAYIHLN